MSPETLQVVQSVDVVEGVPVESLSAEKYILYCYMLTYNIWDVTEIKYNVSQRDKEDICILIRYFSKTRISSLNIFNIWLRFLSRCFKEVSTPFIWRMWDMRYEILDLRKGNEIWDMRNEISDICPLSPWRRRQLQDWAGTLRRGSWPRAGLHQGSPATTKFVLSNIVIQYNTDMKYWYYQYRIFNIVLIIRKGFVTKREKQQK